MSRQTSSKSLTFVSVLAAGNPVTLIVVVYVAPVPSGSASGVPPNAPPMVIALEVHPFVSVTRME